MVAATYFLRRRALGIGPPWLVLILVTMVPLSLSATKVDHRDLLQEGRVVEEISFRGLRKTREDVLLEVIDVEPGTPASQQLVADTELALMETDLFAEVIITPRPIGEDGLELEIAVDEKLTLIPIPFFSTNGSDFTGGLILLESNLLGLNQQLIAAGFGGNAGFRGFFAYSVPSVAGSKWQAGLSAAGGRSDFEQERPDELMVRESELDNWSVGGTVGYRFTRELSAQAGLRFEDWRVRSDSFVAGLDPLEDVQYLQSETRLRYDGTRPIDVLRVGPQAEAESRTLLNDDGWDARLSLGWAFPVARVQRLRLLASGGLGDMPSLAEQPISGRDGYRTLPFGGVTADEWGSVSGFYDVPVVSAGWGALVLSHFWEVGTYQTDGIDHRLFWGPGGGFRVYLRQVAIPALGLDLAYNIPDEAFMFSFTLGGQM